MGVWVKRGVIPWEMEHGPVDKFGGELQMTVGSKVIVGHPH